MPTFKGKEITRLGTEVKVGDYIESFQLIGPNLETVTLADFDGKRKLISVIPSIDTGVCDFQTRHFNQQASQLENTVILTVSMDLPFAQKRWCGANGIENVLVLSDHKTAEFGLRFGVLIEELRLLNRAIFILDEENRVMYVEYLEENGNHPNYEAAVAVLKD